MAAFRDIRRFGKRPILGAEQLGRIRSDDDPARLTRGRPHLDFSSLGQRQCILDVDAEIPDGVLNLGVAEQNLNCPEIPCCL